MGFFADIIRDSRRGGMAARSTEAPLFNGSEEVSIDAPAAEEVGAVASDAGDTSVIRLREEGGGQPDTAGQRPVQDGAVTRQVAGPSLSEHTPVAGIPEVIHKGVIPPNTVAREQAGCESDRTGTGDFRVEQMGAFHDGGSIDVSLVSEGASDSFVRESSSGYATSRTGKASVETQGRRQAAVSRAGSTIPPEQLTGEMAGNMPPEQAAEPVARRNPPAAAKEIPVTSIPQNSLSTVPRTEQMSRMPEETHLAGERGAIADGTRHEPLPDVIPAAATISSSPALPGHGATERQLPAFSRGESERSGPSRPLPPPEPQVRIGTIEVVVVAPAPVERSPRSEERSRPDLASRHYLRNL